MNRKNILILLAIAAIFAAIAFTLLQKNPVVEEVIVSEDAEISESNAESISDKKPYFGSNAQLYAIIFIKNVEPDDSINIQWLFVKDSSEELVQENIITLKNEEGSGRITVSFAKKDNTYQKGSYIALVSFKEQTVKSEFVIN